MVRCLKFVRSPRCHYFIYLMILYLNGPKKITWQLMLVKQKKWSYASAKMNITLRTLQE